MPRSAGLDALRAAACLLVLVFHLQTVAGLGFGPLQPFVHGGDAGVFIFFALSGYLLYRPFALEPVGQHDLASYGLKRAARILPGYLVALVALTLLTQSPLPSSSPLAYLTISSSYSIPLRGFLGSAWTLSAEVLFYATLPLLAAFARGRQVRALGGLAVVSMIAAVILRQNLNEGTEWLSGSYPVVFYAFVPGMLVAAIEVSRPGVFRLLATRRWLAVGLASLALGLLASESPVAVGPAVGSGLLVGWLLQHRVPYPRLFAFLGGMSYATYLWHKDLIIVFGPIGAVMALAGAAASWVVVERPILDWAHRLLRRRAAKAATAAGAEDAPLAPSLA